MTDSVQFKSPSKSESHKTLRLAKIISLFVGIGSCLASVTGSVARWPITAWSMYGKYAEPFPSSFTSINELRAIPKRAMATKTDCYLG